MLYPLFILLIAQRLISAIIYNKTGKMLLIIYIKRHLVSSNINYFIRNIVLILIESTKKSIILLSIVYRFVRYAN